MTPTKLTLDLSLDRWQLRQPFVTAQERLTHIETLTVTLGDGVHQGRGEALGVDYLGETPAGLQAQIEALRPAITGGLNRAELQNLLPRGGARNALDCALWDLEAKRVGLRAWVLADQACRPVRTVMTLALDEPAAMAAAALQASAYPVLKLKLNGERAAERLAAVRAARPDAELVIDANGGWNEQQLDALTGALVDHRVAMLEQPLLRGQDQCLAGIRYPVPLCADESCQGLDELEAAAERYPMINIKLDKCGGLTEALAMVRYCQRYKLGLMVGNMLGSSLAMAPGLLVAQHCRFVDLDGPLWARTDRQPPLTFNQSQILPPEVSLWG